MRKISNHREQLEIKMKAEENRKDEKTTMLKFEKLSLITGNCIFIGIVGLIISIILGKHILFWIGIIIMMILFTITFNKLNELNKKIEKIERSKK